MVEVQKNVLSLSVYGDWYLIEHPEYMVDGLSMSQFSFQIPRPLQENYVRKRPTAPHLTAATHSGRPLERTEDDFAVYVNMDCYALMRFKTILVSFML
ncbi:hypothetical protein M0R45_018843 [Rubus argutus]|uniref:Uncharacterized protein n=1 Tax=Rubus argutus TaxID=59490 RepID=A0AAW1X619_RUBAR